MATADSTRTSRARPGAVTWFYVYAALMCCVYLICVIVAICFLAGAVEDDEMSELGNQFLGVFLLAMGLPSLGACLLPLLLTPRPWLWTYDLVIVCLGMTSACCLPVCIPLLIFWMKPEVKQYFGKT